jgi:prephenate dehydrogenase (NADP+)
MGTAWRHSAAYPWETTRYVSGVEVVKVNITLRIYAAKWHVYAGLAMLNPDAQAQIQQYARSCTELFKLMVEGREEELSERVWAARKDVFGWERDEEGGEKDGRAPILLGEDLLDQFSLGQKPAEGSASPNSHLSLLAMVDCWAKLGIRPFEHLEVAGTPVFMLWIGAFCGRNPIKPALTPGVAEYLFRSRALISSAISAALSDKVHRPDDIEFCVAARGWSECVSFGNFDLYQRRFTETAGESSCPLLCRLYTQRRILCAPFRRGR